MALAARTLSQVALHMGVAFVVMFGVTGSVAFGGLAALLEPVCNVALLPLHKRLWAKIRSRNSWSASEVRALAAEKLSQVGFHMTVAFAVIYWASGSLALGGIAAIIEPVCNVALLGYHDKLWESLMLKSKPSLKRPNAGFAH